MNHDSVTISQIHLCNVQIKYEPGFSYDARVKYIKNQIKSRLDYTKKVKYKLKIN